MRPRSSGALRWRRLDFAHLLGQKQFLVLKEWYVSSPPDLRRPGSTDNSRFFTVIQDWIMHIHSRGEDYSVSNESYHNTLPINDEKLTHAENPPSVPGSVRWWRRKVSPETSVLELALEHARSGGNYQPRVRLGCPDEIRLKAPRSALVTVGDKLNDSSISWFKSPLQLFLFFGLIQSVLWKTYPNRGFAVQL